MSPITIFIAFVIVAIAGWAIAEAKTKAITFTHSEEEAEEAALIENEQRAEGFAEKSLRDILKNNSTKGFNAC